MENPSSQEDQDFPVLQVQTGPVAESFDRLGDIKLNTTSTPYEFAWNYDRHFVDRVVRERQSYPPGKCLLIVLFVFACVFEPTAPMSSL